jgi:hypothetical protein
LQATEFYPEENEIDRLAGIYFMMHTKAKFHLSNGLRLKFDNYILIEDLYPVVWSNKAVQTYIAKIQEDRMMETVRKRFGLLGQYKLLLLKGYFTEKFKTENLEGYTYENDLTSLDEFSASIANTTDLKGINVTIPYKEAIMLHLDSLSKKE